MSETEKPAEVLLTIAANGTGTPENTEVGNVAEKTDENENGIKTAAAEETGTDELKDDDVKMVDAADMKFGEQNEEGSRKEVEPMKVEGEEKGTKALTDGEEAKEKSEVVKKQHKVANEKTKDAEEKSEGVKGESEVGNEEKGEGSDEKGDGAEEKGDGDEEKSKESDEEKSKENEEEGTRKKRRRGHKVGEKGERKEKKESEKTKGVLRTPTTSSVDRPVRERKTVERLVEIVEKETSKAFLIEKGRGTPLKDIPNVAYKLSKKKPADIRSFHLLLFGRKGKMVRGALRSSRGRRSGGRRSFFAESTSSIGPRTRPPTRQVPLPPLSTCLSARPPMGQVPPPPPLSTCPSARPPMGQLSSSPPLPPLSAYPSVSVPHVTQTPLPQPLPHPSTEPVPAPAPPPPPSLPAKHTLLPSPAMLASDVDSHAESVDQAPVFHGPLACWISGKKIDPDRASRYCTELLQAHIPGPVTSFKKFSIGLRDYLYDMFKRKYEFVRVEDLPLARSTWESMCQVNFRQIMHETRKKAEKLSGSQDCNRWKEHGPIWITREDWEVICDNWADPKWQDKSQKAKTSRAAQPEKNVHTSGSSSFATHKQQMSQEFHRPLSFIEVFDKTHKKKGTYQFVSQSARTIAESYDRCMLEKYGQETHHPELDSDAWVEAAGPAKKGRLYDFGQRLDTSTMTSSSSCASSHAPLPSSSTSVTPSSSSPSDMRQMVREEIQVAMGIFQSQLRREIVSSVTQVVSDLLPHVRILPQASRPAAVQPPQKLRKDPMGRWIEDAIYLVRVSRAEYLEYTTRITSDQEQAYAFQSFL